LQEYSSGFVPAFGDVAQDEDRRDSKLAKVTISEKSVVIAMTLRIIGSVTYQIFCHQLAPSIAAAS
jgi:hypothetical protein